MFSISKLNITVVRWLWPVIVLFCLSPCRSFAVLPEKADTAFGWFEQFKKTATDEQLYRFLYAMPKGGDLHNHLSGSARAEWLYEMALEQEKNGYVYYTRVKIQNCRAYGYNEYGRDPYLLMFLNIQHSSWVSLPKCEQNEYVRLQDLNESQLTAWLNSIRLDKTFEGRNEFFQKHWQRLNHINRNPHLQADNLVRNMQAFSAEGLVYLETQFGVQGYLKPDGSMIKPNTVANIIRQRLQQKDAMDTGMIVRLQLAVLRFTPHAEQALKWVYKFVHNNSDLWVAVNLVGREDNDKGHPLRFLDTFRTLRKQFHSVKLSIHGGEADEPNSHVKDTLLLGAERIGHGLNLISDPDTMLMMRHGPYLVETNLISNLMLEYFDNYQQHPFPEYLRIGIPVALSTDDRGMWDSNMTDEFFVAVKEFNLSWSEIVQLSRNSLKHSFTPERIKAQLLNNFELSIKDFEDKIPDNAKQLLSNDAVSYSFICRFYSLCEIQAN